MQGLLGLLLWATLRSTAAWADKVGDDRGDLFPEGAGPKRFADILEAGPPPLLETSLGELAMILERPAQSDPGAAGTAAMRIAGWAEEEGYRRTAAEFYQLAANVCPANPRYALAAANAARQFADYLRAETWLQRTIGLSRQEGDWSAYGEAYISYGTMMRRRGNIPAARRHFERALRRATRHGITVLRARACHDLFVVELEAGRYDLAQQWGIDALRAYPPCHAGLPRLAHDMAHVWVVCGAFAPALKVYQAVEPLVSADGKPVVWGGLALAAAGVGDAEIFEEARCKLQSVEPRGGVSEAWIDVAKGARRLGRPEEALGAVETAARFAAERKERKVEFLAEELRHAIMDDREASAPVFIFDADATRDHLADEVVLALHGV